MVVQQADSHRLQRLSRRRDLRQDVDAVLVLVDHLLQTAQLTFDPAQPPEIALLVLGVSVHDTLHGSAVRLRTLPYPRTVYEVVGWGPAKVTFSFVGIESVTIPPRSLRP